MTPIAKIWFSITAVALFTVMHGLTLLRLDAITEQLPLLLLVFVARVIIVSRVQLTSAATLACWAYTEVSFFWWVAIYGGRVLETLNIKPDEALLSCQVGSACIVVMAVTLFFLGLAPNFKSKVLKDLRVTVSLLPARQRTLMRYVAVYVVSATCLSLLCQYLGISVMGGAYDVVLPFKIKGLLNAFRTWLVPLCFLILLDYGWNLKSKLAGPLIAFFLGWSVMESFFRASRSTVAHVGILLCLLLVVRRELRAKVVSVFIGAVACGYFLFPLVSSARLALSGTAMTYEDFRVAVDAGRAGSAEPPLLEVVTRQFETGWFVSIFSRELEGRSWGRFSDVVAGGGPAKYHTEAIKGIIGLQYSAGSTTVSAGYLMGGIPGALVAMLLCAVGAQVIDAGRLGVFTATNAGRAFTLYYYLMFLNEDFTTLIWMPAFHLLVLSCAGGLLWAYGAQLTSIEKRYSTVRE
jgi:hypothetical protein